MTGEVSNRLFADPGLMGTDLVSLNVQRGRDHGLPGYPAWRRYCGLREVRSFDDLKPLFRREEVAEAMKTIYEDVEDIDLFVAGLAENREHSDGLLGQTFACILG